MKEETDIYLTISRPSPQTVFKERKSKFLGYAFPIQNEDEIRPIIEELRNRHQSANHVCYAWQLGVSELRYRVNDDGEPNNSAGMPIYGQIQSFDVTNVLVAVVRIFGGTKLGVGGLIGAYRTSAQITLEACNIVQCILMEELTLLFNYPEMEKVMRIIKQYNLEVINQKLELTCVLTIAIRKTEINKIKGLFIGIRDVQIQPKVI